MQVLQDRFGRQFSYLRLSVTDACNFRCTYCLPQGYKKAFGAESFLGLSEIRNLVTAMSELGVWKIRLTGGEPTLRRDLIPIARCLSEIPGVRKIALSTNGYRLREMAQDLRDAGVSSINVSVDSLDPTQFQEITGSDRLKDVLGGIEKALSLGFQSVKVNAVLLTDWNSDDLGTFMEWIRTRPVSVRFIELMPTGQNRPVFQKRHVQSQLIQQKLLDSEWKRIPRSETEASGPAVEYTHPQYEGRIGLIAPYSSGFCSTCNRLRVTSQGGLRLCLFGEKDFSIRHLLQSETQKEELKDLLCHLLQSKEVSHYLPDGRFGNNQTFSAMGG